MLKFVYIFPLSRDSPQSYVVMRSTEKKISKRENARLETNMNSQVKREEKKLEGK